MANKVNRKKRIIIAIVSLIVALALAVMIVGGNFLVSFAIGRYSGTTDVAPESTLSEESVQAIVDNWRNQKIQSDSWLKASKQEFVTVMSQDGLKLSAEAVITDENSHLWVIAVHGYRGNHSHMEALSSYYGLKGYNALMPDLRGCGKSEGDYIGMGWPDRLDMLKWIEWITERDGNAQIVLHGISMGGATVMMTSGEKLPKQVKAIVEDCGYTSVWDIFADEAKYLFNLPSFPILNVASAICSVRAGYGFTEASSVKQVEKSETPILFIHGSEDNFVHTEMIYDVYEACKAEKQMLIVDGAGHGNSYNHAPELYFDTVFAFLDKYVTAE